MMTLENIEILDVPPASLNKINRSAMNRNTILLLKLYEQMLLIRSCEEAFVDPIVTGKVRCPVHLYSGQEAIAVGVCQALNPDDFVFGNHRSHGHYLAKTGDLQGLVSEVFCRLSGCSRGRGGSMHLYCPEKGFLGSAPIVSGTVSLATGAAMMAHVRNTKQVSVTFFGDGAIGEGVVYESINFAALRNLPVLFVCENNLYATHMPIGECRVHRDIAPFAAELGAKTFTVDGNDIKEVASAAIEAVSICRNGKGPCFIECKTYRLRGHVGPDDNIQGTHIDIRPKDEIAQWHEKDPIVRTRNMLIECGLLTESRDREMYAAILQQVRAAVEFAVSDAYPPDRDVLTQVF